MEEGKNSNKSGGYDSKKVEQEVSEEDRNFLDGLKDKRLEKRLGDRHASATDHPDYVHK